MASMNDSICASTGSPAGQARSKIRQAAQEATQKVVDRADEPGPVSVTVRAVSGLAARELIDASAGADLVVVGSRRGGGFAELIWAR
jgi:nucleotide-binding universal stress UspA family protein